MTRYFTDATVWIDYFSNASNNEELSRVVDWVESVVEAEGLIFVTPEILLELVCHFFYAIRTPPKKVRDIIRTVTRQIRNLEITTSHIETVKEVVRNLSRLTATMKCDIGEMSILPFLFQPDTVFVSSDENAIKSFSFAPSINPRVKVGL